MTEYSLGEIQRKLKAPKNQLNKFGGYKYRSCEDILEAVKPFISDTPLILTDEIVEINGRFYVKSTASFMGYSAVGFARESESKKGMDEAQITASSTSYARKLALCGLFAIDDTRDAEATNTESGSEFITKEQAQEICKLIADKQADETKFLQWIESETVDTILAKDYKKAVAALKAKKK